MAVTQGAADGSARRSGTQEVLDIAADRPSAADRLGGGPDVAGRAGGRPDSARGNYYEPLLTHDSMTFRLPRQAKWPAMDGVRLEVDFDLGGEPVFSSDAAGWFLTLPRPPVNRLEYQFSVSTGNGTEWIPDPNNPGQVPNPFGAKSEVRWPEYRLPQWLSVEASGRLVAAPGAGCAALGSEVRTTLWCPADLPDDRPAPLLLVHDGSDMADRGSLLQWATAAARVRRFRIALLDPAPGKRDDWYAANPDYTAAISDVVLPALAERVTSSSVCGIGASLGAVAMLMLQRHGALDAAVLQSGSFFTHELDPQESGWGSFARITTAVEKVERQPGRPAPVVITCGAAEENRGNNERLAAALHEQDYDVHFRLGRDAHTMIGWRDSWFPAVNDLIGRLA